MKSMRRALITGISGFVGSHLADHLSHRGWYVAGYDLRAPRVDCEFYRGDLSEVSAIRAALRNSSPDVIFHLAGILKAGAYEDLYKAHLFGTVTLLDAILASGIFPRVIIASSSAVYGSGNGRKPITEKSGLAPQTHYALSKAAQEMAALRYFHVHGLQVVCVRTFNLLGPGLSPDMACSAFARQIAAAERSGKPGTITTGRLDAKRDFVDVRDAVRAYELIAKKGKPGEVYNVCSGRAIALSECLSILLKRARIPVNAVLDPAKIQSNDVPLQIGSAEKLHLLTGWAPKLGVKKSLIDLLDDWREGVAMEKR